MAAMAKPVVLMRWLVALLLFSLMVPATPAPAVSGASCHVDLPGAGLFAMDLSAQGGPSVGGCRVEFPTGSFLSATPAAGCEVSADGVRQSDSFDFVFFHCETGVYDVVNSITFS